MPRPAFNRRRQNSFNKFSPKRRAGPPDTTANREYLQKKLANKSIGNKPENSDDSDGIVTSRPGGRGRKQIEIYASGAVAKGDKPGAFPTRSQRTRALRSDTDEILVQRSRSTSRAASVASMQSAQVVPTSQRDEDVSRTTISAKRRKLNDQNLHANGNSTNTQADTSVLGRIKPRKRQNSILETMGIGVDQLGLDSSAIHSDDEERFLPDEVSTPAQDVRNKSQLQSTTTSSLKRKRAAEPARSLSEAKSSSSLSSVPSQHVSPVPSQPNLPVPSRTQQRKLRTDKTTTTDDDNIMAPPESSDSEEEPNAIQLQPVQLSKTKKQEDAALSTKQLQNLMPSKQRKPVSVSYHRDEFDIEEDSTSRSEDAQGVEEPSNFSPVRTRKGPTRGKAKAKAKAKVNGPVKKATSKNRNAKTKDKTGTKSTKTTSYTPSPVRLRTPLPLSSSKSRRTEAKSPSKQDTALRDKSANTPVPRRNTRVVKKRYGGSHRNETGKENQPISLSDVPSSSEDSLTSKEKLRDARKQANGPEIQAWSKKWANIDDFKLEFEEVSASTRGSSPNGMAR